MGAPMDNITGPLWTNDYGQSPAADPDVSMINGREAADWEQPRILAAKLDARARAARMVAGARGAAQWLMELVDHAQQGVCRPGSWEREWLMQAFGGEWPDGLEPDTDNTAGDGHAVFDRPIRPCPADPPCEHPLSAHVGEGAPWWCLECSCGDELSVRERTDGG